MSYFTCNMNSNQKVLKLPHVFPSGLVDVDVVLFWIRMTHRFWLMGYTNCLICRIFKTRNGGKKVNWHLIYNSLWSEWDSNFLTGKSAQHKLESYLCHGLGLANSMKGVMKWYKIVLDTNLKSLSCWKSRAGVNCSTYRSSFEQLKCFFLIDFFLCVVITKCAFDTKREKSKREKFFLLLLLFFTWRVEVRESQI